MPGLQFVHVASPSAEYVPARHWLHEVLPSSGWERPAVHSLQAVCSLSLMASSYLPAGHSTHLTMRSSGWNCPAAHVTHPVWPATFCDLPFWQSTHESFSELSWYLPATHLTQAWRPSFEVYCPGPHAMHAFSLWYLPMGQARQPLLEPVATPASHV